MEHDASLTPPRTRITPLQAIALGCAAVAIAWGAWSLRDRPTSEEVDLLPGSVLPQSELAIMEAAFDRAQLSGHRTDGGRVWVPRARHSAYMRALVDAEALPREFGASLRRALASNGPWTSTSLRADTLRVAIQDELALVLCSMPGIERAAVLYDDAPKAGLSGGFERTASVSIRTQPDTELESGRVQAIRVLVASAIAGLPVERVAVTDLRSGRVFAGPAEPIDGAGDPARAARLGLERATVAKIRQSLAFIRGVVVDVTLSGAGAATPAEASVTVPGAVADHSADTRRAAAASVSPADANAPAAIDGRTHDKAAGGDDRVVGPVPSGSPTAPEGSLQVLVAVPDVYFDSVVAAARDRRQRRGGTDAWTEDDADRAEAVEIDRLTTLVSTMLPDVGPAVRPRIVVAPFTSGLATPRATTDAGDAASAAAALAAWWRHGDQADAVRRLGPMVLCCLSAVVLAAVLWRSGAARRDATGPTLHGAVGGAVAGDERRAPATVPLPSAAAPERWREAA